MMTMLLNFGLIVLVVYSAYRLGYETGVKHERSKFWDKFRKMQP